MMNGKAATRGNWQEVWDNFDRRQSAKQASAANDADQGADLLSGVAAE